MDSNVPNLAVPATATTNLSARPLERVVVLDIVKGIAICLMVLGHVTQGLAHMDIVASGSWLAALDNFVYRFHMNAFFFAAGAVLALRPPTSFPAMAKQRLRTLYYPHVVWGVVAYIVAVLFVRYFNSPIEEPGNVGRHVFEIATGQKSWFLVTLLLASVLIYPVMRWNALLAVAGALTLILIPTDITLLGYLFRLTVFLVLGFVTIRPVLAIGNALPPVVCLAIALALFAVVAILPDSPGSTEYLLPPYRFLLGVLGTVALCALSFAVVKLRGISTFFIAAGLASLAIFLLHSFATGAARTILLRIAPSLPAELATAALTAISIAMPMAVYFAVQRLGWTWVFAWPTRKRAIQTA